ncbi:MAG: signal peptidase I [Pyrinomonadaceae bacterium]
MKVSLLFLAFFLLIGSSCSMVKKIAVQPVKVEGVAMEPGLKHGDRIFIARSYDRIGRGDIIIFYYPADQSKSYIKRAVGLPNDRVEIREGRVLVNGESLPEPYVDAKNNQAMRSSNEIKLAEDSYYVLGDNRDSSNDSRSWGPLPKKFIYGKFASKYYSAD